jgi:hypothetical protein
MGAAADGEEDSSGGGPDTGFLKVARLRVSA